MRETLHAGLLTNLATGPKSGKELATKLGVSQPTLSRTLTALGEQVVVLGRGRTTLYARPRILRGLSGLFPVYRVDEHGVVYLIGNLQALLGGGFWWQAEDADRESRYFDQLPWFLQDMRPDGFIGRDFALRHGAELGLPEKLREWHDDDVLIALARRGEDHVGNLLIGDESLGRYLHSAAQPLPAITEAERGESYAELALMALEGDPPGSSAGGEQPKFTALVGEGAASRQVLVKFSPPLTQADGGRWGDLLRCEDLALRVVAECGIAAARSQLVTGGGRVFLEVERFDRSGRLGRNALFSLRAIDGAYVGCGGDWLRCAGALHRAGVIAAEDARRMRWLKVFGDLIANSDMHAGNLSFRWQAAGRYTLAPVYDMLPMLYRPVGGELLMRTFAPPLPGMETASVWPEALQSALRFWELAAADAEISVEFRAICRENHARLQEVERLPGVVAR
ncbi:MAG: type II toxin-antitoxin system HipA family toxin YjjJ [Desulfuromonadales bacterium]|nr:type II toxin-antitoxin system HipA family toxin YjjJ [Desulfuromonadales bacterium]